MRLSELVRKEIINLVDGQRLGLVGDSDLSLDETTGRIDALWVPMRRGLWGKASAERIPWDRVRRVGPEVLIVEIER
jgi:YlmC/YmxH family sporulation protein